MTAVEWSKKKALIIHVLQRSLRGAKFTLDYAYSAARLQRLAGAFVHGLIRQIRRVEGDDDLTQLFICVKRFSIISIHYTHFFISFQ